MRSSKLSVEIGGDVKNGTGAGGSLTFQEHEVKGKGGVEDYFAGDRQFEGQGLSGAVLARRL